MWFHLVVIMAVVRAIQFLFRRRNDPRDGADGLLNLNVAKAFQALYGGTVYQALRIPDSGGRGRHVLDSLLLTDRELYIFSVQGLSGTVRVGADDTWMDMDSNGNMIQHPNPVSQLKEKAAVLAQYIMRRGVELPKDFFKLKVVLVNLMASPEQEILLQPEVVSYDRWEDIQKKASSASFLGFETDVTLPSTSTNKGSNDLPYKQLQYILSTAPTWDRLELREGGILFGDFVRFKGPAQDVEALAVAKRSKISHYEALHKWNFWRFLGIHTVTEVKVVCTLRDHRQGSSVQPTKVEIPVRGDLEIIFQVEGTSKPRAYKLQDVVLLVLHA